MARVSETVLWHDYETTGVDSRRDRPMVFAAVRTNTRLEEIEPPVVVQFMLADDVLPSPEACLITGLDPDRPGTVSEIEGARTVLGELERPDTCTAGFNSVRFDDEITRFMLWRNLLPVFDREMRNGNSRFDLIDLLRAACALRPDGMVWPNGDEGAPSFRLQALAEANDIAHDAHDALSDVRATIELARRLDRAQPALFSELRQARWRRWVQDRLREFGDQPFVHVSRRFPAAVRCTSLVMRVSAHPRFSNQVLCVDLRHDPQVILDHDVAQLREWLFTPRAERPDDAPRVGAKGIHLGRCPVIAPRSVLDDASVARIELDLAACERHAALVAEHRETIAERLQQLYDDEPRPAADVDEALYDGFVEDDDAALCREVHSSPPDDWLRLERSFVDGRLGELLFRLRARNHPDTLRMTELQRWREHCRGKLANADAAFAEIASHRAAGADPAVLDALEKAIRRRVEAANATS